MFANSLARVAATLSLLLGAVALAADASEYPHLGAPGLRVFATSVLPLLVAGFATLAAAEPRDRGPLHLVALAVNVALLIWSLPGLARGMPPFFVLRPIVAALLVAAAIALVTARR